MNKEKPLSVCVQNKRAHYNQRIFVDEFKPRATGAIDAWGGQDRTSLYLRETQNRGKLNADVSLKLLQSSLSLNSQR